MSKESERAIVKGLRERLETAKHTAQGLADASRRAFALIKLQRAADFIAQAENNVGKSGVGFITGMAGANKEMTETREQYFSK
ncbi:MAG: hypothetical protein RLZZ283_350 [Candidatus Parcubacteria bacterium]|jgi:hypothetical protein